MKPFTSTPALIVDDEVLAPAQLADDLVGKLGCLVDEVSHNVDVVIVGYVQVPILGHRAVHVAHVVEWPLAELDDVSMPEVRVGNVVVHWALLRLSASIVLPCGNGDDVVSLAPRTDDILRLAVTDGVRCVASCLQVEGVRMANVNVTIRMDEDLKKSADALVL